MNHDILKSLLKQIKEHEDLMSLVFGALAVASLIYLAVAYSTPRLRDMQLDVSWFFTPIQRMFPGSKREFSPSTIQEDMPRTHKTTAEDTLWKLAQRYYNDGYQWGKIYEANRALITNPNVLEKDLELVIPE